MQIVSTNISEAKEVLWKGKKEKTGIFKKPVDAIVLETEDVAGDAVVDRKYHGGVDKACYLFTYDIYDQWKEMYPDADWSQGMFGENLTVDSLDERDIYIGDIYKVGEAIIEVSEYREPCYKLGIRFDTQKVLKDFINQPHCGVYVRVLRSGKVESGDQMILKERVQEEFSLSRVYWLRYHAGLQDIAEVKRALKIESLAESAKRGLRKRMAFLV